MDKEMVEAQLTQVAAEIDRCEREMAALVGLRDALMALLYLDRPSSTHYSHPTMRITGKSGCQIIAEVMREAAPATLSSDEVLERARARGVVIPKYDKRNKMLDWVDSYLCTMRKKHPIVKVGVRCWQWQGNGCGVA